MTFRTSGDRGRGRPDGDRSLPPRAATSDVTVRAMNITVGAESGRACLIVVEIAEEAEPKPLPGAKILSHL